MMSTEPSASGNLNNSVAESHVESRRATKMLTMTQEIKRLEQLLNGETIEGLKLDDPGLGYEWVIQRIANLRQIQQEIVIQRKRREKRVTQPALDPLDSFIEELLDIARENPIDDARIIIRDRLLKDAVKVIATEHHQPPTR